ncbi:MAG: 50S ribosomal protein L25 [Verrucomicrobia bacterium]|nr:50S ribosomal protein L25 [Verrucomicrobiota bacterium]
MKSVALKAYPRSVSGRNAVKKLRTTGRVPATIYGAKVQAQNLELVTREVSDLLKHSASEIILLDLTVEGDARAQRLALMQEVQHHALSGKIQHVDFHEVAPDELVTIHVPVEPIGEPVGVKAGGGVLEHVVHKLKVIALPKDLPEFIQVDVSALEIGKSIHLGDIKAPPGVKIIGHAEASVFAVAAPVAEVEVVPVAAEGAAAAGEVEMIKEKKEDGTEGAAKKDDKAPAGKDAAKKDEKPAAEKKK